MGTQKDEDFAFSDYAYFIKPFRWAFFSAIAYLLICISYIYFSSKVARIIADNADRLHTIELIKGTIFVILSSILIFSLLYILFKRLSRQHETLLAHKNEILISQRQALAGIFASSVAHDINNVLTILDYHWYLLTQINSDVKIDTEVRTKFEEAIKDLQILSQRLMNTGKENIPSELEIFDLADLINQTLRFLRKYKEVAHCRIDYEGENEFELEANPTICRQLLVNLILNAGRAIKGPGHILVELQRQENNAVLKIHDNGPGIPEKERENVFKAYYTTQSKGTGLGLVSIKVYVDVLSGRMDISDSELGGACFRIEIPI